MTHTSPEEPSIWLNVCRLPWILSRHFGQIYNNLTSCLCTSVSLQHNFLCSTKINSGRASCCAMRRRGFSSCICFKIFRFSKSLQKIGNAWLTQAASAILCSPAAWGSVPWCPCRLCREATGFGVPAEQRQHWDLGRRASLGSLCVSLPARHSLCLISHLGRSVFLRLPCSVLCNLTSPTIHQVIERGFMFRGHSKNSEKLIFGDILKKVDNKYPRKKAQIMALWGGLDLNEGHNRVHPGVPSMGTACWVVPYSVAPSKQLEDNGMRNSTAKPGVWGLQVSCPILIWWLRMLYWMKTKISVLVTHLETLEQKGEGVKHESMHVCLSKRVRRNPQYLTSSVKKKENTHVSEKCSIKKKGKNSF